MLNVVQMTEQPQQVATFDDFWTLWPADRRVEKKAARDTWARMSEADRMAALAALVDWRRVWAKIEPQYIKHPHRWLRGECWTDELPSEHRNRPAAQAPAKLAEVGAKTEMPEKVRLALAKMRGN